MGGRSHFLRTSPQNPLFIKGSYTHLARGPKKIDTFLRVLFFFWPKGAQEEKGNKKLNDCAALELVFFQTTNL